MRDVPLWRAETLAEIGADGLRATAERLRDEQAVRGLDSLPEVALHPILRRSFEQAGFGALAEHPYPGAPQSRPRHAERERCDLVLVGDPAARLIDPVSDLLQRDKEAGTLFDPAALEARGICLPGVPGVKPEEAFWLEVKAVGQFTFTSGVPGPNQSYASELLTGPAEDAIKLERDPLIAACGVMLVMFTEDERTSDHDFAVVMHRMLDRQVPVGSPGVRKFGIPDLIGNSTCTVAVVPLAKSVSGPV